MNIPTELKYTKDHEWVRLEGDIGIVGITDYAQSELGDIVYVELPEEDSDIIQNDIFGTIEAVKAVSDLFMPLSGKIIEISPALEETPEIINTDPYGEGWMIKIKVSNPEEIDHLLNKDQYQNLLPS